MTRSDETFSDSGETTDQDRETNPANPETPLPRKIFRTGEDETTRREKAMGLDINPATGRAYESQGGFQNLGLGAGGRFYDGKAVPRIAKCSGCEARVVEHEWGQGFENCGAFDFCGQFFLCSECVLKVLSVFPRIKAIVKVLHGGDLRRG